MALHMMKLVVGPDSLEDFAACQRQYYTTFKGHKANIVRTRHTPRQAQEIVETGGSIYRIIKGYMCCRQRIVGFDQEDTEDGKKCLILTDPEIIRTYPTMRRPFQGWRYLKENSAPPDIGPYIEGQDASTIEMEIELKALGLL